MVMKNRALAGGCLGLVLALVACGGGGGGSDTDATTASADTETARVLSAHAIASDTPAGAAGARPVPTAYLGLSSRLQAGRPDTLPAGLSPMLKLDSRLVAATGQVRVWVKLSDPSVAAFKADRLLADGQTRQPRERNARANTALRGVVVAHAAMLRNRQDQFAARAVALGGRVLARTRVGFNGVALSVDAKQLKALAALVGVTSIAPMTDYRLSLSTTVPYVGASKTQALGFDGTGTRVAIIDTGIDYTHFNLGGLGTVAAYTAANGSGPTDPLNTQLSGLFPTAKVVGGYDFIGDNYDATGVAAPDPDPIDAQSHGTHVADIVAGKSTDGKHVGVAPGAKLYAVKVCSLAGNCPGDTTLQGIEYSLDPDGDGDPSDAVDVMNLSLGVALGSPSDPLAEACEQATRLGVVVVAAAGNDGDFPYVISSPGLAPGVIAVAQTAMPNANYAPLITNAPASLAGVIKQTGVSDWAPVPVVGVTGDLVYLGTACPTDTYPAAMQSAKGKIALVYRGDCEVSLKVDRAAQQGAIAVVLLSGNEDYPSFGLGGGHTFVPMVSIAQSAGAQFYNNFDKNGVLQLGTGLQTINVTLKTDNSLNFAQSLAITSSRGPTAEFKIKPEIGAPGASVSAEVGTGNGQTAFGGTSGATPMVAGSAAILLQAHPTFNPLQIKALLMNSAETQVVVDPTASPPAVASVSRIGAGELRADRALALKSMAYDSNYQSASLSFGLQMASAKTTINKTLRVENFSPNSKTFALSWVYRVPGKAAATAVKLQMPASVTVPAFGSQQIAVSMVIDADKLPAWIGSTAAYDPDAQTASEVDGAITLRADTDTLTVPWHVVPRKSSDVSATLDATAGVFKVRNGGAAATQVRAFSLIAQSPKVASSALPSTGSGLQGNSFVDIRAIGMRETTDSNGEPALQAVFNVYGRGTLPNYVVYEIDLDFDGDGLADAAIGSLNGIDAYFNALTGEAGNPGLSEFDLASGSVVATVPRSKFPQIQPGQKVNIIAAYAYNLIYQPTSIDQVDYIQNLSYTFGSPGTTVADATIGPRSVVSLPLLKQPTSNATAAGNLGTMLVYTLDKGLEATLFPTVAP